MALAAELKEKYRVTNPPPRRAAPPPLRHPIHSLGSGASFSSSFGRSVMEYSDRDSISYFLPTVPRPRAAQSTRTRPRGPLIPRFEAFRPSSVHSFRPSFLPLPLVSVRVYVHRPELLQRPPSPNHVWEELL